MTDPLRSELAALTLREPDTPTLWEQSDNIKLSGGERIAYEWGVTDTLSDVRALLAKFPDAPAPGLVAAQVKAWEDCAKWLVDHWAQKSMPTWAEVKAEAARRFGEVE